MTTRRRFLAGGLVAAGSLGAWGSFKTIYDKGGDKYQQAALEMFQAVCTFQQKSGAVLPKSETQENPYITAELVRSALSLGIKPDQVRQKDGFSLHEYFAQNSRIPSQGSRSLTDSIARLDIHNRLGLPIVARQRETMILLRDRLEKDQRTLLLEPTPDGSLSYRVYGRKALLQTGVPRNHPLVTALSLEKVGVEALRDPVTGGLREFITGPQEWQYPLVELSVVNLQADPSRLDFAFLKERVTRGEVLLRHGTVDPMDSWIEVGKVLKRTVGIKERILLWWYSVRSQPLAADAACLLRLTNGAGALAA